MMAVLELVLDWAHEKSRAFALFPLKDNIISSLKTTVPGFAAAGYQDFNLLGEITTQPCSVSDIDLILV